MTRKGDATSEMALETAGDAAVAFWLLSDTMVNTV